MGVVLFSERARAHEDLIGGAPSIRPGQKTGYWVWSPKPGQLSVRWTAADDKAHRFHGRIEAESLFTGADRIQSGKAGAVQIGGGGGELRWDIETGKWLDGFDAVYNVGKFLRFSLWFDGQRCDPKQIFLGQSGRLARIPVFYTLQNPPPASWGMVDGFASVSPGKGTAYYIGTNDDGTWFLKVATPSEEEVKFTGNIIATDGRIDLVKGLEKDVDERVKASGENKVQFELAVKAGTDGFRFRPGGGARKLEVELYINGKDVKPEQVFLGKDAKSPAKTAPFYITR
jgi:hypothetical protein